MKRDQTHARETVSAPQSTAASAAGIQATFDIYLWWILWISLKHMQNEKELIRPRRLCLRRELPEPGARNFACGPKYLAPGWFNFACGANYPHQALKGGCFVFVFVYCKEIKPREKPQKIPRAGRAEKGKRVVNRREQDLSPTRLEA